MEKLRVIHVVHSFKTGGMERGIATIIRNASESFEHVVLCLSSSGETASLLPQGISIIELHKSPGNSLIFLLTLARTLKALKPAVVHTRNWGGTDGIIAARIAGIRSVIQGEHGWVIDDPEGLNSIRLKTRRFIDRWVREYTCVSLHLKRWLLDIAKVKGKVNQIYNGVDIQIFCPGKEGGKIRSELGIPEKSFVAGVVGRLVPIKNHVTLFKAFAEVKRLCPDTKLLVVGDGPERDHLKHLGYENVIFLGNRTDIPDILQAIDVFVLPSLNEGISNTILEAMASGLPVVVTKVGGNPELVEDGTTGILVPSKDSSAMASALISYLHNPALRFSHGEAGRRRVIEAFSIENMVRGYETVYRRVATMK